MRRRATKRAGSLIPAPGTHPGPPNVSDEKIGEYQLTLDAGKYRYTTTYPGPMVRMLRGPDSTFTNHGVVFQFATLANAPAILAASDFAMI